MKPSKLRTFGPDTPVIPGITLLEASAGTGKTYQITNLVLRLVVDNGVPLPRILVVTFTKAATAELKDRVRQRLVEAQRAVELRRPDDTDPLLARFVAESITDAERSRQIRMRLRQARETFDQALISTIHGFCQRMLQLHAFETGTAFGRALETDATAALETIVDDWLVHRLHSADREMARLLRDGCKVARAPLLDLAKLAVADPDMPRLPATAPTTPATWLAHARALADGIHDPQHPAARLTALVLGRRKAFNGHTYQVRHAEPRLDALKAWLADPTHPPDPSSAEARWFTATQLSDKATSEEGRTLAAHPFFAAYEAVIDEGAHLATGERIAFVDHARQAIAQHHKAHDSQSFHDLLRDLDRVLRHRTRGQPLCDAIRGRYDAALIDEFQDTDALQWRIFGRVFGGVSDRTRSHYLYLIGDPKQAIYGFRGANVHVYLAARQKAPSRRRFTMRRNYRSDGRLIAAMNHVFDRTGIFGDTGIDYIRVDAHHTADRLDMGPQASPALRAPLQLRWVDERAKGGSPFELFGNTPLPELLASACAADLVDLLSSSATIDHRPVRPGDCAVLVRSHRDATTVHSALVTRGVPAVISSQGQVFTTPEALSLQRWLNALARAGDDAAARVLAADPLLAWSAAELPAASTDPTNDATADWWERWLATLAWWRVRFLRDGFMATFRALLDHIPPWSRPPLAVGPRVLGTEHGDRRMTDLLHLAELLHSQHVASGGGLVGLHTWLERQRHDGHADSEAAEVRLETDAEAVQVVTVHKSKGLQYGVVYAPFLWKDEGGRNKPPVVATAPDDPTHRRLVLAQEGDLAEEATARADADAREEGTRLLYVALTRARHRCVVYCPGMKGSKDRRVHGPLGAVLHGSPPDQPHGTTDRIAHVVERFENDGLEAPTVQWNELVAIAESSVMDGVPTVAVRPLDPPHTRTWQPPVRPRVHLAASRLERMVDDGWRRHSYSALTRANLAARAEEAIDPARGLGFDDDGQHGGRHASHHMPAPPAPPHIDRLPDVPLAPFPAGADAGTCLHAIFENLDFRVAHPDTPDPEALEAVARQELGHHGFSDPEHVALVTEHFPAVLTTPLGPLLPDVRLCDIAMADRLDELRFDFPIAGGEAHGRADTHYERVSPEALRDALATRGPCDTVPMAWIDQVAGLGFPPIAGMMTGSIDLVFRQRTETDPIGKWFVVDYKSNRLDPHHTGRTPLAHFHFAGMRYEMAHHHYFLQYHLYGLALHRFLRARLGDAYDYDTHFGGVAYLFVRGMTGAEATDPTRPGGRPGVFTDRPPHHVIAALDAVFAGTGAQP